MHVRSQLRHELWRAATAPRLQYCLLLCAPRCCMHAISCEGNARIPRSVVMGRKRPSFAITVCFSVLRTVAVLHRCHVCVTPQPRPTCETLPTGLSLLEGEGWPSQAMRWVAPRRREPHWARAREAQRRVAANCHTQHAVKSCVPRRAVASRLPMPPPRRAYT